MSKSAHGMLSLSLSLCVHMHASACVSVLVGGCVLHTVLPVGSVCVRQHAGGARVPVPGELPVLHVCAFWACLCRLLVPVLVCVLKCAVGLVASCQWRRLLVNSTVSSGHRLQEPHWLLADNKKGTVITFPDGSVVEGGFSPPWDQASGQPNDCTGQERALRCDAATQRRRRLTLWVLLPRAGFGAVHLHGPGWELVRFQLRVVRPANSFQCPDRRSGHSGAGPT